jgi:S1-C subfamily serine protease
MMKKLLIVLFVLVALCAGADKNLTQEQMLDVTVMFFKPSGFGFDVEGWIGSGVIVSPDGYIVTNRHVVGYYLEQDGEDYILRGGAENIHVYHRDWGYGGCRVVAVSRDPLKDIALVKIETIEDLPYAEMATVRNMLPGDPVYSVGHPHGIWWTMTKGIISKFFEFEDHNKWIMHDSALNPGNSGGPLFDEFGKIVGINFAVLPPGYCEDMGLAIDARMIALFVEVAIEFDHKRMGVMSENDFRETSRSEYYKGYWYEW